MSAHRLPRQVWSWGFYIGGGGGLKTGGMAIEIKNPELYLGTMFHSFSRAYEIYPSVCFKKTPRFPLDLIKAVENLLGEYLRPDGGTRASLAPAPFIQHILDRVAWFNQTSSHRREWGQAGRFG